MDLEPVMRTAVRIVSRAIHEFARKKHWKYAEDADFTRGDYYIDVVVNSDWRRIYLEFVASDYDHKSRDERFIEVWHYLKSALADEPHVLSAVDLVVRGPKEFAEEKPFPTGAPYVHIPQELIKYVPRKRVQGKK
jgi:hypothetical protein